MDSLEKGSNSSSEDSCFCMVNGDDGDNSNNRNRSVSKLMREIYQDSVDACQRRKNVWDERGILNRRIQKVLLKLACVILN